ncbi:hypothetical protein LQW54_008630 [Pestalotiopsis sp. IQ-011]
MPERPFGVNLALALRRNDDGGGGGGGGKRRSNSSSKSSLLAGPILSSKHIKYPSRSRSVSRGQSNQQTNNINYDYYLNDTKVNGKKSRQRFDVDNSNRDDGDFLYPPVSMTLAVILPFALRSVSMTAVNRCRARSGSRADEERGRRLRGGPRR